MGSRLRYLLAFVAFPAFAAAPAGVTVTRTPVGKELEPPKDPGGNASASSAESYEKALLIWQKWQDALVRTDAVAQRELAAVQACYTGAPTSAHVKLTVTIDAKVKSVSVDKGADPALAACFESVYKGARLPAFASDKSHYDYVLDWKVELSPASAPPTAIDRDLGFGMMDLGADKEALGSAMSTADEGGLKFYARELDADARWFGVSATGMSYAFDADGRFTLALVHFADANTAFMIRSALKERYGQAKWDGDRRKWYWRGKQVLIDTSDATDGSGGVDIWIVAYEQMRASDPSLTFPGDPVGDVNKGPRLPSFYGKSGN